MNFKIFYETSLLQRVIFIALICYMWDISLAADVIRIGGLFDHPNLRQDTAFRSAVDAVNSDRQLLARARLSAQVETVTAGDSFAAAKRVCKVLQSGVAAVLGPQSSQSCAHVQSMCSAKHVPHIQTRSHYPLDWSPYSLNLYPHPSTLAKAYSSVLRGLGWTKFTVIYETVEGLVRVQEMLKDDLFRISLRQLPNSGDFRPLLKECKKSGNSHVVLDVERLRVADVLRQALQVGMMTSYHHYFITSLDLHTLELKEFRHGGSNISALRLVDPASTLLQQALKDLAVETIAKAEDTQNTLGPSWRHLFPSGPDSALTRPQEAGDYGDNDEDDLHDGDAASYLNVSSLPTEVALIYDAVRLLATAVDDLGRSRPLEVSPLSCDDEHVWQHGNALAKYLKWVQLSGLSGLIRFDESGFRKDVSLDVIELTKAGLMKVGRWSTQEGVLFPQVLTNASFSLSLLTQVGVSFSQVLTYASFSLSWSTQEGVSFSRFYSSQRNKSPLSNRTLVATTVLAAPYAMLKQSTGDLYGNDRFEGFSVDLLSEIAKSLGFAFTLRLAKDGQHGKYDPAKEKWTGLIGELLEQEADLAIGDLTITYEREQVVDFTMPWMNLGISILYRKASRRSPNIFSFLAPLSLDVWLYIGTSYLAVSLLLHCLARVTPYEEHNRTKDNNLRDDASHFTLGNCLWFIVGSLLQHGTEQQPRACSTRILAALWWFFTLIMISSYTANLAAFLTAERLVSPIESAEDLAAQTRIKYGSLQGGSTWNFFSTSKVPTYQKMFSFMESQRPSVYTSSNQEGVDRVLRGDGQYAFLMESSSIDYVTERDCRLTRVGGLLDAKGYGIALPSGSPYRALVNDALLRLQESGELRDLRHKWWREQGGGGCEPDEPKNSSAANSLDLSSVGGVFAVLGAGMALAVVVAFVELVWRTRARAVREQVSCAQLRDKTAWGQLEDKTACGQLEYKTAWGQLEDKTAWGQLEYKTAWGQLEDKTAWGQLGDKTALGQLGDKTAWGQLEDKTAWGQLGDKIAWRQLGNRAVSFWSELCQSLRSALGCPSRTKKFDSDPKSKDSSSPSDSDSIIPTLGVPARAVQPSHIKTGISGPAVQYETDQRQSKGVFPQPVSHCHQHLLQQRPLASNVPLMTVDMTPLKQPGQKCRGYDHMVSLENFQLAAASGHAPHCLQRRPLPPDSSFGTASAPSTGGTIISSCVRSSTGQTPSTSMQTPKSGTIPSTLPRRGVYDSASSLDRGSNIVTTPKSKTDLISSSSRANLLTELTSTGLRSGEPSVKCFDVPAPDVTEELGPLPPPASVLL
ncbi:Ionotropic glutamate receptor [Trinorchestia longiramus]|nr:Ionotropic glutamate receptor [Trinorchestia longiramus]